MTDPHGGYSADHAEFYDAHVTRSERGDEAFYLENARDADGPVLELACGTGRIYLELLRAGVDADGFDLSPAVLDVLRRNAASEGLEPNVWQADMTTFDVDRTYDLAICAVNAIQNLLTIDDQESALRSVYEALDPGGAFVFDVFVPNFEVICEDYGEWQTDTVPYQGADHEVRTRSRLVDPVEQQFAVETEVYDPEGEEVFTEERTLKMLPKREVELLVRRSPFPEWEVTGDFTGEPIESEHSIQVWTLRR